MEYPKSKKYDIPLVNNRIMGPNPLKLQEELLQNHSIPAKATVLDLGSGQGVTSAFLAREYGFTVYAADLWSDPTDNLRFFQEIGLGLGQAVPIHADAAALPFAHAFFDAVVCTDSYNYFGRSPGYLERQLLPFVKRGGWVYIAVPGMKKDYHDTLPPELLLSWTKEQLDYLHDAAYWRRMVGAPRDVQNLSIREMESAAEPWRDWLACENEYARGDRRAMEAGAGRYLNFISIVLQKG